jgi:hypothetical protein
MEEQTQMSQQEGGENFEEKEEQIEQPQIEKEEQKVNEEQISGKSNLGLIIPIIGVIIVIALIAWFVI